MKKYSKLLLIFLFIFSVVLVTGCGSKKESVEDNGKKAMKDAAGTYKGIYLK